jgi:hypothetical protein
MSCHSFGTPCIRFIDAHFFPLEKSKKDDKEDFTGNVLKRQMQTTAKQKKQVLRMAILFV